MNINITTLIVKSKKIIHAMAKTICTIKKIAKLFDRFMIFTRERRNIAALADPDSRNNKTATAWCML